MFVTIFAVIINGDKPMNATGSIYRRRYDNDSTNDFIYRIKGRFNDLSNK